MGRSATQILFLAALAAASGCGAGGKGPAKATPPATVAHHLQEGELNTVTLTEEAEKRLGLRTAEVERLAVPRLRPYGGEITLPAGSVLTVMAPVTGTLQPPKGQGVPAVGAAVDKGQPLFALAPHALTQAERVSLAQTKIQLAQIRIDAEAQLKQAEIQQEAAKVTYDRAARLYREQAGTKKELDDAAAQLELAQKALEAAGVRQKLTEGMELDGDTGLLKNLEIGSPRAGIVRAVHAAPGEMVPAGAPLFDVMDAGTVWVRVPVYAGEAAGIDQRKPAEVRELSAPPGAEPAAAKPVASPPTAQPQASAVDLYYELPNPDGRYRPGQRVSVQLPLAGEETALVVPWSAVVHDIHGGTWVYVRTGPRTYARRRVQVRRVSDGRAVLAEGPAPGDAVVSAGAAELFGTEFGFGGH